MEPMGAKSEPKRSQRVRKGSQRVPKGSERATKMVPKIALGARVDFGSENGAYIGMFLGEVWFIFRLKSQPKIHAKIDVKKNDF